MDVTVAENGRLHWRDWDVPCRLGRSGIRTTKREGDGATPAGIFPLRRVLFRADRVAHPKTGLPVQPIALSDGWCDDPNDPAYNRPVTLPFSGGHEILWRTDGLYDVIVVLGHNDKPVVPGLGSAVFLHVADPAGAPTAGCVALPLSPLLALLADCTPASRLIIRPGASA